MYKITCTNTSGLGLYKHKDEKLDNRFNKKRVGCIIYEKYSKSFLHLKGKVLHVFTMDFFYLVAFFFLETSTCFDKIMLYKFPLMFFFSIRKLSHVPLEQKF